jgi:hypothetical protein
MRVIAGAGLFTRPGGELGTHWIEQLRVGQLRRQALRSPARVDDDSRQVWINLK